MPPANSSSLNPDKHDAIPLVNSGSLEGFIKYMRILASSSDTQFASAVLGEITQQCEQIDSRDEELKVLHKEILSIEETKRTTINDMFTTNEQERARQKESATHIESLHAIVGERESKIAELSRNLEALQQKVKILESTCSQEVAKVSQSAKDISTLQVNLKEKDKMIDQMKTAGSKLKSLLSSEQKKTEDLEVANASMNTDLQTVRAHVQNLEDLPVQSSDINDNFVTMKFTSLWTSAIDNLSPLLEQDITEDVLQNEKEKSVWEKLKKADTITLPPSFPLIPSNSSAAKAIRLAVILTVLFREIDQHIFRPSYFLSEANNLRGALAHLAGSNGEREAFCRRVLLSIDPNAEQDALKHKIRAIVQKMSVYAGGLFSEAQHDSFCTKIKTIAQNAAEVWLPVQRSRQKFETDYEPFDPEDDEWDRFPPAGENTEPVTQDLHGLYVLNVFPSQELYVAAQHEAVQTVTAAIARRYSTRTRRQSIAGSNGKPFLDGNTSKV
ncbi:uncharacterized protein N7503_003176 [Penicillium pulvis]|uniref:uncharacterized protein n=1 Tax=Penicillium pulvis TaxID=1562058 RepID=UPI00254922CB|nr:uncharacterized protein N7503_003176 [Penicillium pulvis]KAJ5805574.1 hypothetical protein N7503_003176 [Penicillium pulvis]